jgi:NAD(P)-dependent dehydrogenase (short-subunit alcohol dehydrogenase family)
MIKPAAASPPLPSARPMLKGKSAVITGSTSGIGLGLGIARILAGQGANVMLNGFGPAAKIERLRGELAASPRPFTRYGPCSPV